MSLRKLMNFNSRSQITLITWLRGYFRKALWEKFSRTRWPNVRQQSVRDSCSHNRESAVADNVQVRRRELGLTCTTTM